MFTDAWRDAALLASQGWNRLAAAVCLQALDRGDRSSEVFATLSAAWLAMGRTEDGLAAALAACLAKGADAGRFCELALVCRDVGLFGEAEACLHEALTRDPDCIRAREELTRLRRPDSSEQDQAALVRALVMRANRHLSAGQDEQALAVAAELEALAPDLGAADLIRGAVLERAERYGEAAECYASAERFAPEKAHAARQRAAAKERAQQVHRARPTVRHIQERLAVGDDEGAARLAPRLLGQVPWAPSPYLLWARLAERRGHTMNALRHLREALARSTRGREAIALKAAELARTVAQQDANSGEQVS